MTFQVRALGQGARPEHARPEHARPDGRVQAVGSDGVARAAGDPAIPRIRAKASALQALLAQAAPARRPHRPLIAQGPCSWAPVLLGSRALGLPCGIAAAEKRAGPHARRSDAIQMAVDPGLSPGRAAYIAGLRRRPGPATGHWPGSAGSARSGCGDRHRRPHRDRRRSAARSAISTCARSGCLDLPGSDGRARAAAKPVKRRSAAARAHAVNWRRSADQ